ncbi:putative ATP-dependent DNA helicase RecQ, partial [Smittium mucronatum]
MTSDDSGNIIVDTKQLMLNVWGYTEFRSGQLESIKRILNGKSFILVTGQNKGKAFIYQISALIIKLVLLPAKLHLLNLMISPSTSLFETQIKKLPLRLVGYKLNNQNGNFCSSFNACDLSETDFLLLTVEQFISLFSEKKCDIGLMVVNSCQSASLNSVSFKSNYLVAGKLIKNVIKPISILAATNVCSDQVLDDLCHNSGLDYEKDIINTTNQFYYSSKQSVSAGLFVQKLTIYEPENSFGTDRMKKLTDFVNNNLDKQVLVFVKSRYDAERVFESLVRKLNFSDGIVLYHGDLPYNMKLLAQSKFIKNHFKIVIAPHSLDSQLYGLYADVVCFYNLPMSMESFLAQTGRARPSFSFTPTSGVSSDSYNHLPAATANSIILYPDEPNAEYRQCMSQILSSHYDRPTIRKFTMFLFDQFFKNCKSDQLDPDGGGSGSGGSSSDAEPGNGPTAKHPTNWTLVYVPVDPSTLKKTDLSEYDLRDLASSLPLLMPKWFKLAGYFGKCAAF